MYYVVMTDTKLSGWGGAANKIAKYVITCETYEEALVVADNAKHRTDMKHISIKSEKPTFHEKAHQVTWAKREHTANWYKPGYFKYN